MPGAPHLNPAGSGDPFRNFLPPTSGHSPLLLAVASGCAIGSSTAGDGVTMANDQAKAQSPSSHLRDFCTHNVIAVTPPDERTV